MAQNADKTRPIVLIVDDQYQSFRSLLRLISPDVFSATWVPDEQQGLKILKDQTDRVHIIIIDLKSSGMGGGGFLHRARKIAPHAAILITAPLGPFLYQEGAFYDFSGPSLKHDINTILLSIVQKMGIDHEPKENKGQPHEYKERFGVIIGQSKGINEVYHLIEKLNDSSATVMIQGESGTGKELVAQTIHQTSSRGNGPFVAINCGAIPANLMESELFGHERGAFTTAVHQRKGKFEFAHGGTLFLDEIGELDRELQVKLLRVLQEREFQRVGGNRSYKTDVRIIAATSQDLRRAVQAGHFRDDLFYRLNVVPIHIPPLRERREDIPLLLDHFFHKIARDTDRSVPSLTEEAKRSLLNYSYQGNVRELANIVERLLVICPNGKITFHDLPDEVREEVGLSPGSTEMLKELPDGGVSLQEVEKELILKTLKRTSWNKAAAARMLGITRRLLYLRLSQYGLFSITMSPQVTVKRATAS
ncbi:MAG: sigma-54-dependent Fis family transcriptional regulator [Proteobacteria bacterium]|nr:sigma-54-dependent Fis family transcriptional regulator [Pseudomonadota bacterium]